jgi:GT2 family glycosyltransferase
LHTRTYPRVAVIGPFYNGEDHVEPWIKALKAQSYINVKVYAVDDASTDRTGRRLRETIAKNRIEAEVVTLTSNRGPSAARNTAIRKALSDGSDLIFLLDMDCRVPTDWVEQHVLFHAQHPEIGILGGAIQGRSRSVTGKADGFCSWFTAVPFSPSGRVAKLHLSTTNMSLKREVFEKVGFFDESLSTGEDVAFCRKARQENVLLWFQSDILTWHLDRDDLESAKRHHYRWGLHSYTLSLQAQGGYYHFLTRVKTKWLVAALVPVIAALNTLLILIQYTRRAPRVWLYLPWIARLKWANALGVYKGFLNPNLCLRTGPNQNARSA